MKPFTIRKLTPLYLLSFKIKGWEFYPITYKEEKYFVKIVSSPRLTENGQRYTVTCQISRYEQLKEIYPGHKGALLHRMDISHLRKVNGDPLNLDLFGSDYSEWNLPDVMAAIFKMYESKMEEQEKERDKIEWDGVVRF